MRGPLTTAMAGGALCCGLVVQPPAQPADTTPAAGRTSGVGSSTATVVPTGERGWTPAQVGDPWYSIPFLPVDSWNPYG